MKRLSLVLICLALLVSGCGKKTANGKNGGRTAPQSVAAMKMDLSSTIEEEGEIDSLKTVSVTSPISGRVMKIFVSEGDVIPLGKILIQIEPDSTQSKTIDSAVTELKEALLDYQTALRDYTNQKELLQRGFISRDDFQTAEATYTKADLRYQTAKKQYDLIRKESGMESGSASKLSVSSTLAGMVTSNAVEEGELVAAESSTRSGTLLFTVADPKNLIVKVDINEYDISKVRIGQKVDIYRSQTSSEVYSGRVYRIAPVAMEKDGVKIYPVEIRIDNPGDSLRFGMSVIVKISIADKKNVLCVPVSALFIENNRDFVLVKRNGKVERLYVKRGIYNETHVEILSGLSEGDEVMLHKSSETRDSSGEGRRPGGPGGGPMGPRA